MNLKSWKSWIVIVFSKRQTEIKKQIGIQTERWTKRQTDKWADKPREWECRVWSSVEFSWAISYGCQLLCVKIKGKSWHICLSVFLCVCLFVCLSVCLYTYLFVYFSLSFRENYDNSRFSWFWIHWGPLLLLSGSLGAPWKPNFPYQ